MMTNPGRVEPDPRELVGTANVDTVPAAVLAAVAAWLTMSMLDRRSPSRAQRNAAAEASG